MASSSSSSSANGNGKCHIRSVSLPSRTHLTTCLIKDVIKRLKQFETENMSSFESVSFSLAQLENVYICTTDLLDMASTQQILHQQVRCSNALLDSSVQLLDICDIARALVSQVKEHVQLLHSIIRRRKGDPGMMTVLRDYVNFRDKARKNAKRLISATKKIENIADVASQSNQNPESWAVTRSLMEVDKLSAAVFQSVLRPFLNPISGAKQSRWPSLSRLVHKGTVEWEEKPENLDEMKHIDVAIRALTRCGLGDVKANKIRLQDAESNINSLELVLESMFRRLVTVRASLLNVISQ